MSEITRREALRSAAAGAAAAAAGALAGCGPYPGPEVLAEVPDGWFRGEERRIATTCGQCQACCGIRVRV